MTLDKQTAFARLHNACQLGPQYDAEDMTVRRGDVRVILAEVLRLSEDLKTASVDPELLERIRVKICGGMQCPADGRCVDARHDDLACSGIARAVAEEIALHG